MQAMSTQSGPETCGAAALTPPDEPFVQIKKDGAWLTLRPDCADQLLAMGIENPRAMVQAHGGEALPGGRGTISVVPFGEDHLVVRHCRRGGLLGGLLGDVYLGRGRAMHEMAISEAAGQRGVLTPKIVAVVQRRGPGPFVRSHVVSLEIEDAITLGAYLDWFPPAANREVMREKRQIIDATAKAVRHFHDAGFVHGDLNVSNLMLRRGSSDVEVFILDLDSCRRKKRISPARRRGDLVRLHRSAMKMRLDPAPFDDEDRLRFLHAYCDRNETVLGVPYRQVLGMCRRNVRWHRMFWKRQGK